MKNQVLHRTARSVGEKANDIIIIPRRLELQVLNRNRTCVTPPRSDTESNSEWKAQVTVPKDGGHSNDINIIPFTSAITEAPVTYFWLVLPSSHLWPTILYFQLWYSKVLCSWGLHLCDNWRSNFACVFVSLTYWNLWSTWMVGETVGFLTSSTHYIQLNYLHTHGSSCCSSQETSQEKLLLYYTRPRSRIAMV